MVRFRRYADYGDGDQVFIGTRQNNGDFDWFPVITVKCLDEYSDFDETWLVSALAVSPSEAGQENLERACGSYNGLYDIPADVKQQALALAEYGTFCPLSEHTGNNLRHLMKEAREKVDVACMLTGFVFDRCINALGADGWHALRGQVIPGREDYDEIG